MSAASTRAELPHERDRHQGAHECLGADPLEHQHALEPEHHPGERAGEEDHRQRAEAHEPEPLEGLADLKRGTTAHRTASARKTPNRPRATRVSRPNRAETLKRVEDERAGHARWTGFGWAPAGLYCVARRQIPSAHRGK